MRRARTFARQVATRAAARFGDELLAVYMLGSLAHGGYSAGCSDIDVALFFRSGVDPELGALRAELGALEETLEARLSIFWSTPGFVGGRFPALDQIDLLDHGVLIHGAALDNLPRPNRAAIEAQLRAHATGYWATLTAAFSGERPADKELARCVLYPARLLYTWRTGAMASNDAAVAWLTAHPVDGLELGPMNLAMKVRRGQRALSGLDAYRPLLQRQYAASLAEIGQG
jgi:predicted nucleotidyltransferase